MRKLLFLFLRLLKTLRSLQFRVTGTTPAEYHAGRVVSGKAWEEFCDNLKSAGASLMYPGAPRDAFNQAEGLRYLSRLTRGGLEAFVEYADPSFPVLKRMAHETVKLGADNPDNYYFNAAISGDYRYRIRGKRNTVHYLGFFTQNGDYGSTGGLSPCGALDHRDLVTEPDGTFEIILGPEPAGRNWLRTETGTSMVMVRQTFLDRFREVPAELVIENLDGTAAPAPITPEMIDRGLQNASLFVAGASLLFARWAAGFRKHPNSLPLFDPDVSNAAGGDASIVYYHSYWRLEPDEALEIRVMPPACDSWNFQLNNYWMESLDYRYFTICINKASAVLEPDGSVVVTVAHNDPGRSNWISTCGHSEGTMLWRWYRVESGNEPPEPACRVIRTSGR